MIAWRPTSCSAIFCAECLAVAAMQILGVTDRIAQTLDVTEFVPAPGQGCVAVECRADDDTTARLLGAVDHDATRTAVEAERAFLAELGTGCSLPVAAHAIDGVLHGFLADPAANRVARGTVTLPDGRAARLDAAAALARDLRGRLGG